jgi:hypothetical protein
MEMLAPLGLVVILLFGPFIALNAYLLVWLCGPAIRRAGRKWEEGRHQAMAATASKVVPTLRRTLHEALSGVKLDALSQARPPARPVPEAAPPDAGHRWLGDPAQKVK